jgi:hypothetical protein
LDKTNNECSSLLDEEDYSLDLFYGIILFYKKSRVICKLLVIFLLKEARDTILVIKIERG